MLAAPLQEGVRTPEARKQVFGFSIRNAVAAVRDLNGLQSAELIVVKYYVDAISIGINRVPYELGDSEDGLSDLRYSPKVIILNLNLKGLGGHATSLESVLWWTL